MSDGNFQVYEDLRSRGLEAVAAARLQEAFENFDEAYRWAVEHGDQELQDQAFCSRSAASIELFSPEEPLPKLRAVLMRNLDPWNCRLAAYTISRIYDLKRDPKKGLFYARIARDLSYQTGRKDWIASSHLQIGNHLLAESYFEEAYTELQRVLEFDDREESLARALLLDNQGYCFLMRGETEKAFGPLFESLRSLRRLKAGGYQAYPHLTLSFAYLELGRYKRALEHASRGLAFAEKRNDPEAKKNALYLMGEAANLMGDPQRSHKYLLKLQREHYPDSPHIVDFLLQVDVRQFINLKA